MATYDQFDRAAFPAAPWEGLGTRAGALAAQIRAAVERAIAADRARRELHALPEHRLSDLGLIRADIDRLCASGRRLR